MGKKVRRPPSSSSGGSFRDCKFFIAWPDGILLQNSQFSGGGGGRRRTAAGGRRRRRQRAGTVRIIKKARRREAKFGPHFLPNVSSFYFDLSFPSAPPPPRESADFCSKFTQKKIIDRNITENRCMSAVRWCSPSPRLHNKAFFSLIDSVSVGVLKKKGKK